MQCNYCYRTCLLLLVISVQPYLQWAVEDDGCRTPDRGVGSCILIKQCKPMIDFLNRLPTPVPQSTKNLLNNYRCGVQGREVKVCCPEGPIRDPSVPTPNTKEPPDVSNHPNKYLVSDKKCNVILEDSKIINGNKTGVFEFPFMALLSYRTSSGPAFKCGGSIINDRYILTAAHCITNLKSPLLGVRIGEHDINKKEDCDYFDKVRRCAPPPQDLPIQEIIPHPGYSPSSFADDIGLLRVAIPMNLTVDSVKSVCLPFGKFVNFDYDQAIVIGYGKTETGRSSNELLRANLPVASQEDCKKAYQKYTKITHKQLCVGGQNNTDSCTGDSGGPLIQVAFIQRESRYVQHGIVSIGPKKCATEGFPGTYTRVAYYMDWILNTIKP